jgi:hypothetical protein
MKLDANFQLISETCCESRTFFLETLLELNPTFKEIS